MGNIKLDGIPNSKKRTLLTLYFFLMKICKIEPPVLFFLLFLISRCHFSQLLRASFNIIRKKIFVAYFPFLTDSLKHSNPLNAKRDKSFLSKLPYCFLFKDQSDLGQERKCLPSWYLSVKQTSCHLIPYANAE